MATDKLGTAATRQGKVVSCLVKGGVLATTVDGRCKRTVLAVASFAESGRWPALGNAAFWPSHRHLWALSVPTEINPYRRSG